MQKPEKIDDILQNNSVFVKSSISKCLNVDYIKFKFILSMTK